MSQLLRPREGYELRCLSVRKHVMSCISTFRVRECIRDGFPILMGLQLFIPDVDRLPYGKDGRIVDRCMNIFGKRFRLARPELAILALSEFYLGQVNFPSYLEHGTIDSVLHNCLSSASTTSHPSLLSIQFMARDLRSLRHLTALTVIGLVKLSDEVFPTKGLDVLNICLRHPVHGIECGIPKDLVALCAERNVELICQSDIDNTSADAVT
ncbi:hypothetical protein A7U60_g2077 [Sanghuangporus baumii]|uniref:Uncharacterized protein n=1 Tax=Sanghuangporus baumii TaxID=108892 RepID=A0A9Q5I2Y9_SANBA|nr:hypothetical protein A7U60_g2077 [Sanghuangporus baumii]